MQKELDIAINDYKSNLQQIQIGKINSTYQKNKIEIEYANAKQQKFINKQSYDNLLYNNKL